ncbi:CRP-like cAMP-binding protein [Chryseobacterium ginsenosidimutans]|uniref:Crp/Fnr family transcriptional regulator n=1 Tax=Chryseobacterium ginsenosidimutans TaxID=687846 RepID=UPI0027898BAD|nr:Crp/Fnr family transcriptional regulator [Chryseobacterium ginsenosidimutans]MDQ0595245.1 CRP-like cAMP-binding protein [Chryseobacterium ginsenosidimutans]
MELFNVLDNIISLDKAHKDQISELVEVKNYKKNEKFLLKGDPCSVIGFVIKGSFRYIMDIDGNDRAFDFSVENEFISDYYGMLKSQPASFEIIANHASVVACLPTEKVLKLFDQDMTYQKIGRTIAETEFCRHHERLTSLMYHSPQRRYLDLLSTMPESVLKLPQHLLANYLGITKETLSRIRSRKLQ